MANETTGRRILLADDNADVRDRLLRYLTHRGYIVDVARDGLEAYHALQGNRYDLLVTDYEMPGINGVDLALDSNSNGRRIRTILISGNDKNEIVGYASAQYGLSEQDLDRIATYMQKPVGLIQLIAAIENPQPQSAPPMEPSA